MLPPRADSGGPPCGLPSPREGLVAVLLTVLLSLGLAPVPGLAQDRSRDAGPPASETGAWNSPAAMELVYRAVERRMLPVDDSLLQSYAGRAEGHVHFLADRLDGSDPIPLRVDQVALDLYWRAPNLTRQEIRGLRAEELLPIRDFRYYQDRLTVIQNGFGDIIQVGQGMDVRSVPHPLARYVQEFYEYALGDSVTVRLPGAPEPVRVVKVKVRPRDSSLPAFVGSLFLDAATGAISRLEFTFTPVSYVDRRIDRVRITLEHGLWQGRWWLPFRQQVEVRREIPELDIRVQSVIQGVLTVEEYTFNEELPVAMFAGPRLVLPGADGTDDSHFRRGLFDEMEAQGLQRPDLALLEAEARQMVRERALSGLPATRIHWDRVSSLVRANRVEGVFAGAGLSRSVGADTRISVLGGWASGARQASGVARIRRQGPTGPAIRVEALGAALHDMGQTPGLDPLLNTVATLAFGRDYLDPYRVDGGSVGAEWWREGGTTLGLGLGVERHRALRQNWFSSPVGDPDPYRPLPGVDEGVRSVVWGEFRGPLRSWPLEGLNGRLRVEAGAFEGDPLARGVGALTWSRKRPDASRRQMLSLELGVQGGNGVPLQDRFLLGGMGTLPGFPYRAWGGNRYALLAGELEEGVIPGWVSLRGVVAAGAVGGGDPSPREAIPCLRDVVCPPPRVVPGPLGASGLRTSAGVGVGLVRGILRVDYMWGLGEDGGGAWSVSVDPAFRGWL